MVFPGLRTTSSSADRPPINPKASKSRLASNGSSSSSSADSLPMAHKKQRAEQQQQQQQQHDQQPEYIHDEAQIAAPPPAPPDLRELNNSLEALAAAFPDVQIEVFRELLANFDGESRLAVAADALLKNRVAWVKGRWRVADKSASASTPETPASAASASTSTPSSTTPSNNNTSTSGSVPPHEAFRSEEYIRAVKALASHEFKGLSRSTVYAVLAEHNHAYPEARRTLVTLSSKSWRFTISALFFRRKPVATGEAENHPLVVWRSTGHGAIRPTIRATGSAELDRELYVTLVAPLRARERAEREAADRGLAVTLNEEEAEAADATHECTCCFTTAAWEEFTHCNVDGHLVCFRCVQHSIKEAVFGQGWQSSIDPETGTLRCMSVDGCEGRVPAEHIRRAMADEKAGAEILHRLDRRLAEHSLLASGVPLVRCPFCDYAEVDDVYTPPHEAALRVRTANLWNIFLLVLCLGTVPLLFPLAAAATLLCLLLGVARQSLAAVSLADEWRASLARHRRRRRGPKFACGSPDCGRTSCLLCGKAWRDVHVCHESSLVALRTQVEQAMSMAVKRVCPRCNTSFVKNAGCNKLTCPCGYKMCYVCRADLSAEGYRHFCEHFRPDGDPTACAECDRCNLWESEDTDKVLQAAREEAERRWTESEKRELSGTERAFLETGVASQNRQGRGGGTAERTFFSGRIPTLPDVFDAIMETVFV